MPHPAHFVPLGPGGGVLYGVIQPLSQVTFYPTLQWDGYRVLPVAWQYGPADPVLECFMDPAELGAQTWVEAEPRIRDLQAQGWKYNPRDGLSRAVHVDELEKIEGPPPEGAF